MRPEEIYSILVEANPVPDPFAYLESLSDASNAPTVLEQRREEMQTVDQTKDQASTSRRSPWPAVAAVLVLIVGVAVIVMTQRDTGDVATEQTDAGVAVARAEQFLAARDAAAFQAAAGSEPMRDAELLMWEWSATLDEAGYLGEYGECHTSARSQEPTTVIRVECDFAPSDPVYSAMGVEVDTQPFNFYPDEGESGQLYWLTWGGDDPSRAIRAYVDYLKQFEPEVYDSVCSPSAYPPGSVETVRGLALTPQCAEQLIPHIPAVARWVEQGQPSD